VVLAGVDISDRNRAGRRQGGRRTVLGDVGDVRIADHGGVVGAVDGELTSLEVPSARYGEGVDMVAVPPLRAAGEELHGGVATE